MMQKFQKVYAARAWRSVREIAVAIILTLAAAAFIIAALTHGPSETAAIVEPGRIELPASN